MFKVIIYIKTILSNSPLFGDDSYTMWHLHISKQQNFFLVNIYTTPYLSVFFRAHFFWDLQGSTLVTCLCPLASGAWSILSIISLYDPQSISPKGPFILALHCQTAQWFILTLNAVSCVELQQKVIDISTPTQCKVSMNGPFVKVSTANNQLYLNVWYIRQIFTVYWVS